MTIAEALSSLQVPVCHVPYLGTAKTFITYRSIGQTGMLFAEGTQAETASAFIVRLHMAPYSAQLVAQVKTALRSAGWIAYTEAELYDKELKTGWLDIYAEIEGEVDG